MIKFKVFILLCLCFISCDKDDCSCDNIRGQRFYINAGSIISECDYVDDIEYLDNGYINLYRNGGGYSDRKMERVMKYRINDNCIFEFYDLDSSKVVTEPACSFFSLTLLNAFADTNNPKLPYTKVTCTSYDIGAVTHLNYNPR